jgi:hypothetical protein
MEQSAVRVVPASDVGPDDTKREVLARPEPVSGTADEVQKNIVGRALHGTRAALTQLKEGISWYGILDPEAADAAEKIADDIDNLIRKIKQHERK